MARRRALLVIDMQNLFCHPEGAVATMVGPLHRIEETVPRVAAAIADARARGDQVVYTRHCYDANYLNAGPNFAGMNPMGVTGVELMKRGAFIAGNWDTAVLDEVAPAAGDTVIDKTRYDAFLGTPLESMLRGLGVEELDLCGVVTNVCVETTTRSAYMRDFRCVVLSGACTAGTQRRHETALEAIDAGKFGEVR